MYASVFRSSLTLAIATLVFTSIGCKRNAKPAVESIRYRMVLEYAEDGILLPVYMEYDPPMQNYSSLESSSLPLVPMLDGCRLYSKKQNVDPNDWDNIKAHLDKATLSGPTITEDKSFGKIGGGVFRGRLKGGEHVTVQATTKAGQRVSFKTVAPKPLDIQTPARSRQRIPHARNQPLQIKWDPAGHGDYIRIAVVTGKETTWCKLRNDGEAELPGTAFPNTGPHSVVHMAANRGNLDVDGLDAPLYMSFEAARLRSLDVQ